ncbi:hypothetical protein Tco_0754628 [Tanacetum coccineum]
MPTKIELTLEQSQQGVSNDVLAESGSNTLLSVINLLIADIENDIIGPSDAMHNPSQPFEWQSAPSPFTKTTQFYALSRNCQGDSLIYLSQDKTMVLQPHSSEVGFINHMLILKLSKSIDELLDQEHQLIKEVKSDDLCQGDDARIRSQNSKVKHKGSKTRSQSMNEQSHYKQDKTITRQSINVKRHIFNVISDTEKFEEKRPQHWGEIC